MKEKKKKPTEIQKKRAREEEQMRINWTKSVSDDLHSHY